MRVIDIDVHTKSNGKSVVALGNFDGMHRGHQTLFRICSDVGKREGFLPSVLLFRSHTRQSIDNAPFMQLQSLQDKLGVARNYGIVQAFLLEFSDKIMKLSPEQFVDEILVKRLNAGALVVGTNYRFGHRAQGDVKLLKSMCSERGIEVLIAPEVLHDGVMINSTMIREAILEGHVEEAHQLLGDHYRIRGVVGPGKRRGRNLGFPTANLQLFFPYCLPKDGVYYTHIQIGNMSLPSLTNIGNNPTFEGADRKIETHILDFSGDLYDLEVKIAFVKFLRDDIRFENADALIAQMKEDEATARALIIEENISSSEEKHPDS